MSRSKTFRPGPRDGLTHHTSPVTRHFIANVKEQPGLRKPKSALAASRTREGAITLQPPSRTLADSVYFVNNKKPGLPNPGAPPAVTKNGCEH
jgi:hypothetical protein